MEGNVKKTVRVGIVSSINPEEGTAKVVWPDEDDKVSADLIVSQAFNSTGHKSYRMPDVNEQILCVFPPNSPNAGFIIGALPSEDTPPLYNTADKCGIKFGPIEITLNRADGSINIKTSGTININGSSIHLND